MNPVQPNYSNPSQQPSQPSQQQPKRNDQQSRPKNNSFNQGTPNRGDENNSQQNGNSNWTPKNEQPSKIEIQRPSQPSRQEINPPKQERTNMSLPAPRQESRTQWFNHETSLSNSVRKLRHHRKITLLQASLHVRTIQAINAAVAEGENKR
ncbi:MAG: hypothetical protein IPG90_17485 [Bacteroidetes bacterium]|nr:hypothetical protein [Bacteroidota bacterium]